jgi:hypothetical protein
MQVGSLIGETTGKVNGATVASSMRPNTVAWSGNATIASAIGVDTRIADNAG